MDEDNVGGSIDQIAQEHNIDLIKPELDIREQVRQNQPFKRNCGKTNFDQRRRRRTMIHTSPSSSAAASSEQIIILFV